MASHNMTAVDIGRPLHIVYVWDSEYPWDVRAEKTCLALTEAGHDVHIVARNRKRQPITEQLPEATVHRMPPWLWAGSKLDVMLSFPAFFNPRWRSLIASTTRDVRADLIIVRDLPLCPTAIHVGKRFRIPVVLDMAENYPAMMRDIWTAGRQRVADHIVRNPRLTRLVEANCIRNAAHIITVVEASSERLRKLGVPEHRLTVVSNTPPLSRTVGRPRELARERGERITVVYLGLLEVPRGLNELIDAIKILHDAGHKEFKSQIVGSGRDEALFHERAQELGLDSTDVEFLGRLPHKEALAVVAAADIGVIPHHANESWNSTIPNKLFDYMSFGIPVVSSDARPCAEVLIQTGAGEIFTSGDPRSLAEALLHFETAPARLSAAHAGVAAVIDRYNWEADSAKLLEVMRQIAGQGVVGI